MLTNNYDGFLVLLSYIPTYNRKLRKINFCTVRPLLFKISYRISHRLEYQKSITEYRKYFYRVIQRERWIYIVSWTGKHRTDGPVFTFTMNVQKQTRPVSVTLLSRWTTRVRPLTSVICLKCIIFSNLIKIRFRTNQLARW